MNDLAQLRHAGQALVEMPKPLPAELLPVDSFPVDALPNVLSPWVQDIAERMQCPPDYVAVPLLVAAASLVARHVGIRPQQKTDWFECGNLWALIVGRPGQMKSPAMRLALAPVERLEAKAAEAFNLQAAQHRTEVLAAKLRNDEDVKAAKARIRKDRLADVSALLANTLESEEPTRRRYVVNDLTYEKLGEVLSANPDGVLLVRDEIRGLLTSLSQEESAAARSFYLQAWSGGLYTFDRIGRGTVTIKDARLSIIGAIQPGPICELQRQARRGKADDGMIERFLVAWPDSPGSWRHVDRLPDSHAKHAVWAAFEMLDNLTAEGLRAGQEVGHDGHAYGLPCLRFEDDAREAFGDWRHEFERTIRGADNEGLEGALSKFRHHVPALALTLHVLDGGVGPVNRAATLRALAMAEYFESHTRRLHSSGQGQIARAGRKILHRALGDCLPELFTARDVYRNQWTGLTDKVEVTDGLDMLVDSGWLTAATVETGGRLTTVYGLTKGARHG